VVGGEARARLDEAGMALRDRDREPGADGRPLAGGELDALAGGEVEARVARVGAGRDDRRVVQPADPELDQALSRRVSGSRLASATR
jgi:hypothetical protein